MSKYKNVYTILEKVKKGEIKSYYDNDSDGLFGRLNFYKKADLIKPYVHYIDERKIDHLVDGFINDGNNIKDEFNSMIASKAFKQMDPKLKPDISQFHHKLRANYKSIPQHLKYDIYKMYYSKMEKLDFEERTDKNKVRYKFLENANNPVGKIMSEGSSLKSTIYARNMMMYYLLRLTEMDYVDPNASEEIRSGLNGSNEFDDQDDNMDKMFNNPASKRLLERMMQDAQETCKNLDSSIDKEIQQQLFDQPNLGGGDIAGKIDSQFIRTITAKINQINLSMGSLKNKIKKLLDKSVSYFSSKKTTTYEDLFNSDNVAGLDEYELLHPKLRKLFTEDIVVKDTKSVGKIDIYIDISGSMCSESGVKDEAGKDIRKIDFAKALTAKMKNLDLLNDVYLFDSRVAKWKSDIVSIAMIDANGSTNIDAVIKSIESKPSNAIVLTDAEDNCSLYSEKAFFIGVKGACFEQFDRNAISRYSDNSQVIVFDGDRTYSVDRKGKTVK